MSSLGNIVKEQPRMKMKVFKDRLITVLLIIFLLSSPPKEKTKSKKKSKQKKNTPKHLRE